MAKLAKEHITTKVPIVEPSATVSKTIKQIKKEITKYETINYIYVLEDKKLVGILSIKELFKSDSRIKISDMMKTKLVTAYMKEKQERVVLKSLKYNIKSIPVIDKKGNFLGVVPADELLDILQEEASDDLAKIAGIYHSHKETVYDMVKARIPWILLGLFAGTVSAFIINTFSNLLESLIVVVFYIPVILNISGSVGNQAGIIYIKNQALGNIKDKLNYFIKDLKAGIIMAFVAGIGISFIEYFWNGNPYIGIVIGTAMVLSGISGLLVGLIIPLILESFGKDPAIGTGPVITATLDIIALLVYFGVVWFMI
ncbi:magnesium transporter [Candidatus Micrarchaeota archaeon]|nr:magnesium transporter [Candidatus Micrarchaeota archaeon]